MYRTVIYVSVQPDVYRCIHKLIINIHTSRCATEHFGLGPIKSASRYLRMYAIL